MVDIAGRIPPARLGSGNAAINQTLTWNGQTWVPATHPVLWAGPSAPTDGSVFWYDTDAVC